MTYVRVFLRFVEPSSVNAIADVSETRQFLFNIFDATPSTGTGLCNGTKEVVVQILL